MKFDKVHIENMPPNDKVCSTKMMTNKDNVESSLLTSIY